MLLGVSLAVIDGPFAKADTQQPVRWNTGGSVSTTTYSELKSFLVDGTVKDRDLQEAIRMSGWTTEELRFGLNKAYAVDLAGVSRFLYSHAGETFLEDQTRSYVPYWRKKTTAAIALRAAIVADAKDGRISSIGIMKQLPVSFRLSDIRPTDGKQNVCAPDKVSGDQATSLLSWYVFLPACIKANSER
ncbi:alpha/beta hydrolase [Synechococcus sp. AH-736-G21]|nr:alpha/beta hydrolase [Synechococcus sp. AH-736-G21]